jgi:DNA-binding NarL/FixJ family response regulator
MYRILLIDDHAVVRRGLREILEEGFSEASVGEAATGKEGLEKLREQSWDAVVLDIALPDINGLEVLKQIKADWPTTPVLMLSVYSEDQYGVRMIKAGAAGYLTKASAPEKMVEAVERILSGEDYISPPLAKRLGRRMAG